MPYQSLGSITALRARAQLRLVKSRGQSEPPSSVALESHRSPSTTSISSEGDEVDDSLQTPPAEIFEHINASPQRNLHSETRHKSESPVMESLHNSFHHVSSTQQTTSILKSVVLFNNQTIQLQRPKSAYRRVGHSPKHDEPPTAVANVAKAMAHRVAQSPVIGSDKIAKKSIRQCIQSFTGQLAVVSRPPVTTLTAADWLTQPKQSNGKPQPPNSAAVLSNRNECSHRQVLPLAVNRAVKQLYLEDKKLPQSTLWAPIPRPPSPLQSRMPSRPRTAPSSSASLALVRRVQVVN